MGFSWVSSTDVKGLCLCGGAEALGPQLGIRAGVPALSCKQGLSAGTSTLTPQGCFISQPAQQVALREGFVYKPSMCNNKWPFPE